MRDDRDLPPGLANAVELLRQPPDVRPDWRAAVLRRTADARTAKPTPRVVARRRVTMSLSWAIAAGVACAVAGGSLVAAATLARGHEPVQVAQAPAAAVLPVKFSVVAPNAARVTIVGDFNQWNPATLPMKRSADGRLWEIEVRLPVGRYSYAYLIDGHLAADPAAPSTANDDFGAPSSVVMVRGS